MLMAHTSPVCLDVDIDHAIESPVDAASICQLVQSLVKQSLLEMPQGGELTITACETATGVELELADTGGDVSQRMCTLPMVAAAMHAEIRWQNCPQGGAAVTVTLPKFRRQARKAA